jgi:hypothetical protein
MSITRSLPVITCIVVLHYHDRVAGIHQPVQKMYWVKRTRK